MNGRPCRPGSGSLILGGLVDRVEAVAEIASDLAKQPHQLCDFFLIQTGQRFVTNAVADVMRSVERGIGLRREAQLMGPAVGRMIRTLDPAAIRHPIEQTRNRDRRYIEQIRQGGLVDAVVVGEIGQDPALGASQAQHVFGTLVEKLAYQSTDIRHEEAEALFV